MIQNNKIFIKYSFYKRSRDVVQNYEKEKVNMFIIAMLLIKI